MTATHRLAATWCRHALDLELDVGTVTTETKTTVTLAMTDEQQAEMISAARHELEMATWADGADRRLARSAAAVLNRLGACRTAPPAPRRPDTTPRSWAPAETADRWTVHVKFVPTNVLHDTEELAQAEADRLGGVVRKYRVVVS